MERGKYSPSSTIGLTTKATDRARDSTAEQRRSLSSLSIHTIMPGAARVT